MDYAENPDLHRISAEFLAFVRDFHSQHGFTTDWKAMALSLGVSLADGSKTLYTKSGGRFAILIDPSEPPGRRNFSTAHELAHHLFGETDDDFRAVLHDSLRGKSVEQRYQIEEYLCNKAASILVFPDAVLEAAVVAHGLGPRSVFDLAKSREGSLWAATIRVVSSFDSNLWGYVVSQEGVVEFAWSNSKYRPASGFPVDSSHVLLHAWNEPVEERARPPFRSGKSWPMAMKAASNGRRIVALFADPFPAMPGSGQAGLFDSLGFSVT